MSFFWNKLEYPDKTVYKRSKSQKRNFYILMVTGWLLFVGVPTLILNIPFFRELARSNLWAAFFLVVIGLGVILIIFSALGAATVNFKLAAAKRKNRQYQIASNGDGDTITIHN